ncbi:MAG: hypothetical protein HYX47_04350 [Burkholderiales bacterium]|nr:hypothetical protein [Burkholderiales bacterium]
MKALNLLISSLLGFFVGAAAHVCKLYFPLFSAGGIRSPEMAAVAVGLAGIAIAAWAWYFRGGAWLPVVGFFLGCFALTFALFPITFWFC